MDLFFKLVPSNIFLEKFVSHATPPRRNDEKERWKNRQIREDKQK